MPLRIKCPEGHELTVPTQRAGTTVRCPICRNPVLVPVPQAAAREKVAAAKGAAGKQPSDSEDVADWLSNEVPRSAPPATRSRPAHKPASKKPSNVSASQTRTPAVEPRPARPKDSSTKKPANQSRPERPKDSSTKTPDKETPDKPSAQVAAKKITITKSELTDGQADATGKAQASKPDETRPAKLRIEKPAVPVRTVADKPKEIAPPELPTQPAAAPPLRKPDAKPDGPVAKKSAADDSAKKPPPMPAGHAPPDVPKRDKKRHRKPQSAAGQPREETLESQPEKLRPRGYEHDRQKKRSAYQLASAIAFVAIFSLAPAAYECVRWYHSSVRVPLATWVYVTVFVAAIQLIYALYLAQLPDWGTVWVVAVLSLLVTTTYATLMGVVLFRGESSAVIQLLQMNGQVQKKSLMWCISMVSVSSLLTYFCGRIAVRWHRAFVIATTSFADK